MKKYNPYKKQLNRSILSSDELSLLTLIYIAKKSPILQIGVEPISKYREYYHSCILPKSISRSS